MKGWGPELTKSRPDSRWTWSTSSLKQMYEANPDFVFTVTRDFVAELQNAGAHPADDVPAHPYAVAMESARLSPNSEVSIYPWKETKGADRAGREPRAQIPAVACTCAVPHEGRLHRRRVPLSCWRRHPGSRAERQITPVGSHPGELCANIAR